MQSDYSSYSASVSADKITKLTIDNFATWQLYITAVLEDKDLYDLVTGKEAYPLAVGMTNVGVTPAEDRVDSSVGTTGTVERSADTAAADLVKAQREWKKKDRSARSAIVVSVSESMAIHVQPVTMTAKETWDKVCAACQPKGWAAKAVLLGQLWRGPVMQEGERAQDHINRIEAVCNKLTGMGVTIKEEDKAIALILSLPPSWSAFVTNMETASQTADYSTIVNRILGEEQNRIRTSNTMAFAAFTQSSHKGASSTRSNKRCTHCLSKGDSRSQRRALTHNDTECFDLHPELRHPPSSYKAHTVSATVNSFFVTVKDDVRRDGETSVNNTTELQDSTPTSALSSQVSEGSKVVWHIDSGASAHLCNTAGWFTELRPCPPKTVTVANKSTLQCQQEGTIHVRISAGNHWKNAVFTNVLYVPDLGVNLLSVQAMTKAGLHLNFTQHGCTIRNKRQQVIGYAKAEQNLYHLVVTPLKPTMNVHANSVQMSDGNTVTAASDWQLIHARMGHLNAASVKMLFDRNMVLGLTRPVSGDQEQLQQCKGCLEGKAHRQSIPKAATHRASDPLQVVHTDLCGPLPEPSMGSESRYFITFIDDFSRHTSVFLLPTKDAAINAFRKYKAWAENYTGFTIKTLRSDGGGEYISTQFNTLLTIYGITRQVTVPRTPQQNGVAERANRTIMEAARSMLHAASLPLKFWGEAVTTAVYLRNRSPTRALNGVTPYEAWRGEKPDLFHLRVWGCRAFMHVNHINRTKLGVTARPCVFLGYPPESKGWLVYDPIASRLVVTRDLTFQEDVSGKEALVGGGTANYQYHH